MTDGLNTLQPGGLTCSLGSARLSVLLGTAYAAEVMVAWLAKDLHSRPSNLLMQPVSQQEYRVTPQAVLVGAESLVLGKKSENECSISIVSPFRRGGFPSS